MRQLGREILYRKYVYQGQFQTKTCQENNVLPYLRDKKKPENAMLI